MRISIVIAGAIFLGSLILTGCTPTEPEPKQFKHTARQVTTIAHTSMAVEDVEIVESAASISNFLGGKNFKLAFCRNYRLFVLSFDNGSAEITELSQGDETFEGKRGRPNSPLFSRDGKWVAYTGATGRSLVSFVHEVKRGGERAWRLPIFADGESRAEPHWYTDTDGKLSVYVTDSPNSVKFDTVTNTLPGKTFRAELIDDSIITPLVETSIPGGFKGGFSRDGAWAFTSYVTSALYNIPNNVMTIFMFGEKLVQHCNASINAFAPGSARTDYVMLIGFGNVSERNSTTKSLVTVNDTALYENQHENIWIFNKDKKIVWQCKRTNPALYYRWEKPEWSTHPLYATSVGVFRANDSKGDLYIIKIGDLSNNDESALRQAEGSLKIATGFGPSDWTHLWVAE